MTPLTRGRNSSAKNANSTANAPIWKSYLAIRSSTSKIVCNDAADQCICKRKVRARKRAKPLFSRGEVQGRKLGVWMTLGTPLTTQCSDSEDDDAVLAGICKYWKQLSVNERQQVLFLSTPELVKQLYKINLSLLCVGLMRHHLKTSNRGATAATPTSEKVVEATIATKASTRASNITAAPMHQTSSSSRAAIDTSQEKAYELLEAMEFMDLGTGVLTVKMELVETTDRFFTLVGNVLTGFLTSLHVLTESNFIKLFVTESETINTWEDYQRLIAMLLEQLILRSYVSYLEGEAAHRMEELLLEVSLQDKAAEEVGNVLSYRKKKSKKKKKKKMPTGVAKPSKTLCSTEAGAGSPDCLLCEAFANLNDQVVMEEPIAEPMPEAKVGSDCQSNISPALTDGGIVEDQKALLVDVEPSLKKESSLNPNAIVFQPQGYAVALEDTEGRSSLAGKRKFDECIVSVPWEDVESDAGSSFGSGSFDEDMADTEDEDEDKRVQHHCRRKQHRREEDAALKLQLQQVYSSTSSLFGWDFSRQCELQDPSVDGFWSERALWRTAPKEVVRFFSSTIGDTYAKYRAPHDISTAAETQSSLFYFNPNQLIPIEPLFQPEPMPLQLHRSLGFRNAELYSRVVSSPDFLNAQYNPSNQED